MVRYEWLEYERGKELLVFLEELKRTLGDMQPIGSLGAAMGRANGDTIETKARGLEIPPAEAVDYFFP